MKFNPLPKQEYLHSILDYNPKTGIFKWKYRSDMLKNWNSAWAGEIAGLKNDNGYWRLCINYKKYKAHRIAYVYMHGDILTPDMEIDHKNMIRTDNRIENLRMATKGNNTANMKSRSRYLGLPKGVQKNKSKFCARLEHKGIRYYLGNYDTPELAHAAYIQAAQKHHGEFARAI